MSTRVLRRTAVIAGVLFVLFWVAYAANEWAVGSYMDGPPHEYPIPVAAVYAVEVFLYVLFLVIVPIARLGLEGAEQFGAIRFVPPVAAGCLIWAIILAIGWSILERLLDRYRRRGRGRGAGI